MYGFNTYGSVVTFMNLIGQLYKADMKTRTKDDVLDIKFELVCETTRNCRIYRERRSGILWTVLNNVIRRGEIEVVKANFSFRDYFIFRKFIVIKQDGDNGATFHIYAREGNKSRRLKSDSLPGSFKDVLTGQWSSVSGKIQVILTVNEDRCYFWFEKGNVISAFQSVPAFKDGKSLPELRSISTGNARLEVFLKLKVMTWDGNYWYL